MTGKVLLLKRILVVSSDVHKYCSILPSVSNELCPSILTTSPLIALKSVPATATGAVLTGNTMMSTSLDVLTPLLSVAVYIKLKLVSCVTLGAINTLVAISFDTLALSKATSGPVSCSQALVSIVPPSVALPIKLTVESSFTV